MRVFSNKDLDSEIWEDLIGFEEYCEISTLGRFKNKKTNHIYNLGHYSNGYEQFSISIDSKRHTAIAHRLVAKQFIPNLQNYPVVNHKNGIRDDNRFENLEWCTQSYNGKHSFKELGRKPRNMQGENNTKAILTEEDVIEIKRLYLEDEMSATEIALKYNMNSPAIWKILNNINWKHIGGFVDKRKTVSYKYVTFLKTKNRWIANIYTPTGRTYLGRYLTEIEAADAVKKHFNSETYILNT